MNEYFKDFESSYFSEGIKNIVRALDEVHSNLHLARVSVVAYAKWRLSFNVWKCKQSGRYELLSIVRLTAAGKRCHTLSFRWVETSPRDVPSCSHSCRALALERAKAHIAITAARYTRQETLLALLLRYCPIRSLRCSAFLFPLKPRILELRRPSRYMEASYMEARVYVEIEEDYVEK